MRTIILLSAVLNLLFLVCPVQARTMTLIKDRVRADLFQDPIDIKEARSLCELLDDEGAWIDLDYTNTYRNNWKAAEHLVRLKKLARLVGNDRGEHAEDATLKRKTLKALNYWLNNDFQNPNWWWPVIGVPMHLSEILLMLEECIDESQMEKGLVLLRRTLNYHDYMTMTGANHAWVIRITILYGLLTSEPDRLRFAQTRLREEIRAVPSVREGGIMEDFSFIQHGPILYSHGYGASFLAQSAELAAWLAETDFALSQRRIDLLAQLVLDGSQWLTRGIATDYSAEGREWTRPNQNASYLYPIAFNLIRAGASRQAELQALLERIRSQTPSSVRINKAFWCVDTIAHHRPDFYVSVRMCSTRTVNSERVNGEGRMSWFLGLGSTPLMRHGHEYENIAPLWDWALLPGVTAPDEPGTQAQKINYRTQNEFAVVCSNGLYGAAGYILELDALSARKSWFFFDEGVYCLGTGINDQSGRPIRTAVNQCHLRGPVRLADSNSPPRDLAPGEHRLENPRWVSHDGFTYWFPYNATLGLKNAPVTGTWKKVSATSSEAELQGETFTLWFEHGVKPENDSYAYYVTPRPGSQGPANIHIVQNDPRQQALWNADSQVGAVVFYLPGQVTLTPGLTLQAEEPCVMLVQLVSGKPRLFKTLPGTKTTEIILNP